MLLPVPLSELTVEHIRQFCGVFSEGLRVEYKQELSNSVRKKLPAIIASFANSYGGVMIVGVRTDRGRPVPPIIGYAKPREELRVAVENICLQNINPALIPRIQEIDSDEADRAFLVIEVDESPEAPHAIENSRRVYIRTGDASNPYDLADVDMIGRLLERRKQVTARWDTFVEETERIFRTHVPARPNPKLQLLVGPRYPASELADREHVFQFISRLSYGSSRLFQEAYRDPIGACAMRRGSNDETFLCRAVATGQFFFLHDVESHQLGARGSGGLQVTVYPFAWMAFRIRRALVCAAEFFKMLNHRGLIKMELLLYHTSEARFTLNVDSTDSLTSFVPEIPARAFTDAEVMSESVPDLVHNLMYQLIWPFLQPDATLDEQAIRDHVNRWLAGG